MGLSKIVGSLAKVLGPATRWLHGVGVGILTVMMFLTFADVIGRYVLNRPVLGAYELQQFMMGIMIALGIGYCGFLKGHINVDILISRLPQRAQGIFNIFHYLIASAVFALACWRTAIEGLAAQSRGFTTAILYIPVFPFYWVLAFGCAVLCLVFFYNALESLSRGEGKWNR